MDAKLREDLFRRYVASLENRLEEGAGEGGDKQGAKTEEALVSTATALLGSYQPDPGQRFRMVRFYEIAENSLRTQRSANLRTLETAFATLETICSNLLLFPWKKEFRCIKVSQQIKGDVSVRLDDSLKRNRKRMSFSHCRLYCFFIVLILSRGLLPDSSPGL